MSAVEPDSLAPLFAPLTDLRGMTPTLAGLIKRACGGDRVIDLLFHLPDSFIDRRERLSLRALTPGKTATIAVEVARIEPPGNARQPTKAIVTDGTAFAELVFFKGFPRAKLLPGAKILVSGKVDDRRNMVHPDHIFPLDQADRLPAVEPVWGLTAGLFPWHLRRPVADALSRVPTLPDWHDSALVAREQWPGFAEALRGLHTPTEPPPEKTRKRLAYD